MAENADHRLGGVSFVLRIFCYDFQPVSSFSAVGVCGVCDNKLLS